MNFRNIKNIIFDLGDVIINIDPPRTYQAFADLKNISLEKSYELVDGYGFFEKYDKGLFSDDEFLNYVRASLQLDVSDEIITTAWNALLLDMPAERIRRIEALRSSYNLYLLSNTCSIHIKEVNNIMEKSSGVRILEDLFNKTYYSYDLGLRKPDAKIYEAVLLDADIKAEETVFLDDNLANIEAARLLGIQVIHVQKPLTMLDYLKDA